VPTEIQLKAIPLLLENKTDLVGLAKQELENGCF
jgi:superfamily II DNA/RNA helicase